MSNRISFLLAMLMMVAAIGCGERGNQVVEAPTTTPEQEKQAYEDYDKQMAESVPNP